MIEEILIFLGIVFVGVGISLYVQNINNILLSALFGGLIGLGVGCFYYIIKLQKSHEEDKPVKKQMKGGRK